jgi:signal transduction histidine kinase/CheY-like chemotaxis protein
MKKESIFIIVVFAAVCIFFGYVILNEKELQNKARKEIADCARVVSNAVWNYDDKLPMEYLAFTCRKNNFNDISIIMREGGEFIKLSDQIVDPTDKLLTGFSFTYHITLTHDIEYNGIRIGYIKADWYPLSIYSNLTFLVFLTLCVILIWYYLKFKDAASNLEQKVAERTVALIKTNEELEREIKKRESVERELIASKEKSEELNKLKSSLLTNMSHEIRTPMNGILGLASILSENLKEMNFADMAGKIYRSGVRLMNTLGAILDLSELQSNTMQVNLASYDISTNIGNILKQYHDIAADRRLFFKYDIRCEKKAFVDERICKHIIRNIADNAIKYTETGGITVVIDSESGKGGNWVAVSIIDTGIGIAECDKEVIFEEFKQLSEGFSRNYEGTGLGLSLVKKMLDLLNGKLFVESKLGEGSCFKILFPEAEKEEALTEHNFNSAFDFQDILLNSEKLYLSEPLPDSCKALLVEDNPVNREITEIFLEGICRVISVASGREAIELAAKEKFSIVFMDINLGYGIDGIKTAEEIKKIKGYKEVPFVALTGYAMSADRSILLDEGFSHYLAKPFKKDDLIRLVSEIFSESGIEN